LPTVAGTADAHGSPPGWDEINQAKQNAGWPTEPRFYIPDDVRNHIGTKVAQGQNLESDWEQLVVAYQAAYPDLATEFLRRIKGELPDDWEQAIPSFAADAKGMATRNASGKVLNALAKVLPELMGGSADLAPSNKTWIDNTPDFQADQPGGRNMHFGVREHAMGAIVNGMAVHGGLLAYGGTFLVFSDYMRGAIRLSALSEYPSIWVFTHDSIGVGEDGPTHQPVEHLTSLRLIPGLITIRPSDANETAQAWRYAIQQHGPVALALTRQNTVIIDRQLYTSAEELAKGAYVLADFGEETPDLILMASGSEVDLVLKAGENLAAEGFNVRVVSIPSWELFTKQDKTYQDSVLLPNVKLRLAVEAGTTLGWERWVGDQGLVIGIDKFGASAPHTVAMEKYGMTVANVTEKAMKLCQSFSDQEE
jgi:transketolase